MTNIVSQRLSVLFALLWSHSSSNNTVVPTLLNKHRRHCSAAVESVVVTSNTHWMFSQSSCLSTYSWTLDYRSEEVQVAQFGVKNRMRTAALRGQYKGISSSRLQLHSPNGIVPLVNWIRSCLLISIATRGNLLIKNILFYIYYRYQ